MMNALLHIKHNYMISRYRVLWQRGGFTRAQHLHFVLSGFNPL